MSRVKLYHYTQEPSLEGIKEKGLLNFFGLMFFTDDDQDEPSVNFTGLSEQGRVVVELDSTFLKVSDLLETDYDEMASYFNPELIGILSDTSKWYCSRAESIQLEDMVALQVKKDGEWINYE